MPCDFSIITADNSVPYHGWFDRVFALWHYGFMLHKILVALFMFPVTFVLLIINLWVLSAYSGNLNTKIPLSAQAPIDGSLQLAAPAEGTSQVLSATIEAGDSRALLIESFLRRHKSPMAPFAGIIVAEADRYSIDFKLVPAIAMCESNGGKRMPKKDEYNFAGIAVYTGTNVGKAFNDWPHAIAWVTQYIRTKYYNRGITDLYEIGAIWAPPSVNTGYSWTKCVESFKDQII